ncbi:FHA domain-containing protein [Nannocystis punicea]|uniref:FHA domain-containing protein n=1 Tax=Nannocystis punicea TaxID=2995304 RepID=A0ABY7H997_9BACT|nr:FHA domain-containing protein [Nannocystis poenicansa]WAS95665.1 FHA domain-containing protein [Nannocystis poenicansa]
MVDLRTLHVIGRGAGCHLRLEQPEVSSLHAALKWSGGGWELRDLGSRNGTWLDERRIPAGDHRPVAVGAFLAFGRADLRWRMVSDAAPPARAFPCDGGPARTEIGGVLSLPTPALSEILLFRDETGTWCLESAQGLRAVADERGVLAGGQYWDLDLPDLDSRTPPQSAASASVCELHLSFRVSPDEEHVALTAVYQGVAFPMEARAHNYLLLTLARRRLADRARAPTDVHNHGWMLVTELQRLLRVEETALNLMIFRIRKQFAERGFRQAQHVVERRRGTGLLRIGQSALSIERS